MIKIKDALALFKGKAELTKAIGCGEKTIYTWDIENGHLKKRYADNLKNSLIEKREFLLTELKQIEKVIKEI